jgi:hypothetical protein
VHGRPLRRPVRGDHLARPTDVSWPIEDAAGVAVDLFEAVDAAAGSPSMLAPLASTMTAPPKSTSPVWSSAFPSSDRSDPYTAPPALTQPPPALRPARGRGIGAPVHFRQSGPSQGPSRSSFQPRGLGFASNGSTPGTMTPRHLEGRALLKPVVFIRGTDQPLLMDPDGMPISSGLRSSTDTCRRSAHAAHRPR